LLNNSGLKILRAYTGRNCRDNYCRCTLNCYICERTPEGIVAITEGIYKIRIFFNCL
jgi:hypothetical protein